MGCCKSTFLYKLELEPAKKNTGAEAGQKRTGSATLVNTITLLFCFSALLSHQMEQLFKLQTSLRQEREEAALLLQQVMQLEQSCKRNSFKSNNFLVVSHWYGIIFRTDLLGSEVLVLNMAFDTIPVIIRRLRIIVKNPKRRTPPELYGTGTGTYSADGSIFRKIWH